MRDENYRRSEEKGRERARCCDVVNLWIGRNVAEDKVVPITTDTDRRHHPEFGGWIDKADSAVVVEKWERSFNNHFLK